MVEGREDVLDFALRSKLYVPLEFFGWLVPKPNFQPSRISLGKAQSRSTSPFTPIAHLNPHLGHHQIQHGQQQRHQLPCVRGGAPSLFPSAMTFGLIFHVLPFNRCSRPQGPDQHSKCCPCPMKRGHELFLQCVYIPKTVKMRIFELLDQRELRAVTAHTDVTFVAKSSGQARSEVCQGHNMRTIHKLKDTQQRHEMEKTLTKLFFFLSLHLDNW